MEYGVSVCEVL